MLKGWNVKMLEGWNVVKFGPHTYPSQTHDPTVCVLTCPHRLPLTGKMMRVPVITNLNDTVKNSCSDEHV
jgi:hypothetical protein